MVSAGEGVFTKAFTLIALWHSVLRGVCEEVKAKNENCLTRARAREKERTRARAGAPPTRFVRKKSRIG